jgi:carbon-monoxide dehydrogenase large subunit
MYKILLSHRLGLDEADIRVTHRDTDLAPGGGGTYASHTGIRRQYATSAAYAMEAAEDDIEFSDGPSAPSGTDRGVWLKDVAQTAYVPSRRPEGSRPGST